MNDFVQFLLSVLGTVVIILIMLGKKVWSAVDTYFETKATNYATKQDIKEITKQTEEVQSVFKKDIEKFNADLQFKYKLYEDQYTNLYAELYHLICQSEALRYSLTKQNMPGSFKEVPIVEIADEKSCITQKILSLVKQNKAKASPKLVKIVNLIGVLEHIRCSHGSTEDDAKFEIELKISLVKIILEDYHWLRMQLQLPCCDGKIESLDTDSFFTDALV